MTLAVVAVVAGVVAGLLGLALLRRPDLCIALWVVVEMSNASTVLVDDLGFSLWQPVCVLTALSTGLGLLRRRRSGTEVADVRGSARTAGVIVTLFVLFSGLQALSLVVNDDVDGLVEAAPELVRSFAFVSVLVAGARLLSPTALAEALVVPLAMLGSFTLLDYLVLGGSQPLLGFAVVSDALGEGAVTPRYSGPAGDPNIWGRILLIGVPFAASFALAAHQTRARYQTFAWGAAFAGLVGGLYLTQSRGALLGLAVAGAVWWLLVGPKPALLRRAVPVVALALLAVPGVGSRLFSLNQLLGGAAVSDYALVERAAAQRVTFEMFRENPLLGVGDPFGRFNDFAQYADIVLRRQVNPHNLYLQFAATGGVLLLLAWLCLVGAAVVAALRVVAAASTSPGQATARERLLAGAAVAALAGWSVASVFLHLGFVRTVLVPVCLCAVLALQTPTRPLRRGEQLPGVPPRLGLALVRVGVFAVVLGLGVGLAQSAAATRAFEASLPVVVLPDAQNETAAVDGYQYDVVTRDVVIPTYAAIVLAVGLERGRSDSIGITAKGDPEQAIVRVSVVAPTREDAISTAELVAADGSDFINGQPSLSRLATASPSSTAVAEVRGTDPERLWAGFGLSLFLAVLIAGGPWWRRVSDRLTG